MPIEGLSILAVGSYLPPDRSVRDVAAAHGADTSDYHGWERFCVARDEDHPSTMGATALERAIARAGCRPESVKLVLAVGVSRDYLPSWSVATEIMRLVGLPSSCFGLDVTIGCLGALTGLEIAQGWLRAQGGGKAAIVAAERWSHTVSHADPSLAALWAHADGASAMIVDSEPREGAIATYRGACFLGHSDFNGLVLVPYGGTRQPVAPTGASPFARRLGPQKPSEVFARYAESYGRVMADLRERFGVVPDSVVCNQVSPNLVKEIGRLSGVPSERLCVTGPRFGHVGSADLLLGIEQLHAEGTLGAHCFLVASTPYAFGAGLIVGPAAMKPITREVR